MKSLFAIVALISLLSSPAQAGGFSGQVQPYWYGGALYLTLAGGGSRTSPPACATRGLMRLAESDPADPVFKAKYAMLLSSWLAGRTVQLYGTGACTSEGDEYVFQIFPN